MATTILRNGTAAERIARMEPMRARPHSPTWPIFYRLEVSVDGTLGAGLQERASIHRRLDCVRLDGAPDIPLELPRPPERTLSPEVHSFGRDHVLLRRFDADGASHLTNYPIVRTDGRNR
jgi:hypothetical protein